MSNKEKIKQRIEKLFALSQNNTSDAEAELALNTARRLMMEHQIEMHELGVGQEEITSITLDFDNSVTDDMSVVMFLLKEYYLVRCVIRRYKNAKDCKVDIIGRKTNIQIALAVWYFLLGSVEEDDDGTILSSFQGEFTRRWKVAQKENKEEMKIDPTVKKLKWNDFILGIGVGLSEALQRSKVEEEATNQTWGLVVVKEEEQVTAWMEKSYKLNAPRKPRERSVNYDSYEKGVTHGKDIKLRDFLKEGD